MSRPPPAREEGVLRSGIGIFLAALLLAASSMPLLLARLDLGPQDLAPEPVLTRTPPLAERVLLIVVDGLGYSSALEQGWMPRLEKRAQSAAVGVSLASFPTLTPPGLRALVSGRRQIPRAEMPGGLLVVPEPDSVLARAKAAGLRLFVVGTVNWPLLFGVGGASTTVVEEKGWGRNHDEDILKGALDVLERGPGAWDMLALHFFDLDHQGHVHGVGSPSYRKHLAWVDEVIERLAGLAGPGAAVLVVADHGQTRTGAHGGNEREVRRTPFVLWGEGVRPGSLGSFAMVDTAPTLSALLGIPPPSLTEGRPLMAALDAKPETAARIWMNAARQRVRKWKAMRSALPWLGGDPAPGKARAERLLRAGSFPEARQEARETVDEMDAVLHAAAPKSLVLRLILALWSLVGAAAFALAWPPAHRGLRRAAGAAAAFLLLSLAAACGTESLAVAGVNGTFAAGAALLILAAASGWKRPGPSWAGWALWCAALAGFGFPSFADPGLWAWLTALGFALTGLRSLPGTKDARARLRAAAPCVLLAVSMPASGASWLRALLPRLYLPPYAPWEALSWLCAAAVVLAAGFELRPSGNKGKALLAAAAAPLLGAMLLRSPAAYPWIWGLCALSGALSLAVGLPPESRGLWWALVILAFQRTLGPPMEFSLLTVTTLAAWGLRERLRAEPPLWAGAGLLAFAVLGYVHAGGHPDISHFTLPEGTGRALGAGFSFVGVAVLVALRSLSGLAAPAAALGRLRASHWTGALPLCGGFAAGCLSTLYAECYLAPGAATRLSDAASYETLLWGLLLIWALLGTLAAMHAARKLSRQRPA